MTDLYEVYLQNCLMDETELTFIMKAPLWVVVDTLGVRTAEARIESEASAPGRVCQVFFNGEPPSWLSRQTEKVLITLAQEK